MAIERVRTASSHEIIEIVSTLCEVDEPVQFSFIKPEPAVRFTKRDGVIELPSATHIKLRNPQTMEDLYGDS